MTNWKAFVDSLSAEDFKNLGSAVHNRREEDLEKEAVEKKIYLNENERRLFSENKRVCCIKAIRERTDHRLALCRAAVNVYARCIGSRKRM